MFIMKKVNFSMNLPLLAIAGAMAAGTSSCTEEKVFNPVISAQRPQINLLTPSAVYTINDNIVLKVNAEVGDAGAITYEWRGSEASDNRAVFEPLPVGNGGNTPEYTLGAKPKGYVGYFACYVTNYKTGAGINGNERTSAYSAIIKVEVGEATAPKAEITLQPKAAEYLLNAVAAQLKVDARVPKPDSARMESITIVWKWGDTLPKGRDLAEGTEKHRENSGPQEDEFSSTYLPTTRYAGKNYYWAQVITEITDNGDGGKKIDTVYTDAVLVKVTDPSSIAAKPVIVIQPQGEAYELGDTPAQLTLRAKSTDGGTISVEWYKFYKNEYHREATPITADVATIEQGSTAKSTYSGLTTTTLTQEWKDEETKPDAMYHYYYALVINTNGTAKDTLRSNIVKVEVGKRTANVKSLTVTNEGGNTLRAEASGNGDLTYQWKKRTPSGYVDVDAGTDETLSVESGNCYYVKVTDKIADDGAEVTKGESSKNSSVECVP